MIFAPGAAPSFLIYLRKLALRGIPDGFTCQSFRLLCRTADHLLRLYQRAQRRADPICGRPMRPLAARLRRFGSPQDKGLFAKYGLAVDLKYMLSATGTQALLGGSIDIVNPATEIDRSRPRRRSHRIHHRHSQSRRAVDVQQAGVQTTYRPARQNPRRDAARLDHRPDRRMLLQQAGMVPGKDIQITHLQGMPDIITALGAGSH